MSIKMTAKDSFYADDTKQVAGGSTFEVEGNERAKQLVERGLAEIVPPATNDPATVPKRTRGKARS